MSSAGQRLDDLKAGGPPAAFEGVLAPQPAKAGGPLCVVLPVPLAAGAMKVFDLEGRRLFDGGRLERDRVCVQAPRSPGVYFIAVQARDDDGRVFDRVFKLAVVRP